MSDANLTSRPVELNEPAPTSRGPRPHTDDGLGPRLLYTILIVILFSLLKTVLTVLTVLQFILLLINRGQRNTDIAQLAASLGRWCAQAARYLTADSDEKPWLWRPFD